MPATYCTAGPVQRRGRQQCSEVGASPSMCQAFISAVCAMPVPSAPCNLQGVWLRLDVPMVMDEIVQGRLVDTHNVSTMWALYTGGWQRRCGPACTCWHLQGSRLHVCSVLCSHLQPAGFCSHACLAC
mgnify:CR=1 FL=1